MSTDSVIRQKAVEAFARFQATEAIDSQDLSAEYNDIVNAAGDSSVDPLVRSRCLQVIGSHGAHFEKLAKAAMQSIVNVLGEPDELKAPQKLVIDAINAITAFARSITSKQEETVSVAADVLIQVIIVEDGYSLPIREAATSALEQLSRSCLSGVLRKLFHLMSDQQEKDDEEFISKQRAFALREIRRVVTSKQFTTQWTEEVQQLLLTMLAGVLSSLTLQELRSTVIIASGIPIVRASNGSILLDTLLRSGKLDTTRFLEEVVVFAAAAPAVTEHQAVAEKILSILTSEKSGGVQTSSRKGKKTTPEADDAIDKMVHETLIAKCALVGARLAPAALVEGYIEAIVALIKKNVFIAASVSPVAENGQASKLAATLPKSLTEAEGLLMALAVASSKSPETAKDKVFPAEGNDANVLADKFASLREAVEEARKLATFVVKKEGLNGVRPGWFEVDALTSLTTISNILQPLANKLLPAAPTVKPSWEKAMAPPTVNGAKRARTVTAVLDAPLPVAEKRLRVEKGLKDIKGRRFRR